MNRIVLWNVECRNFVLAISLCYLRHLLPLLSKSIGGASVNTGKDELVNVKIQLDELIVIVGGNDCEKESHETTSIHGIQETYDSENKS